MHLLRAHSLEGTGRYRTWGSRCGPWESKLSKGSPCLAPVPPAGRSPHAPSAVHSPLRRNALERRDATLHRTPAPLCYLSSPCSLLNVFTRGGLCTGSGVCVPVMFPGSEAQAEPQGRARPPGACRAHWTRSSPQPNGAHVGTIQSHPGPWACAAPLMENAATAK